MNMLFKGVFGSNLYGLNTPESDKDYKGIYLPSRRDILLGKAKRNFTSSTGSFTGKNTAQDVDYEVFSLQEFVKLACEGQTVAIDMLHTPSNLTLDTSWEWNYLLNHRDLFYSKNMNAFMGYVKKQAAKYGVKGSRVKALEDILKSIDSLVGVPEKEYTVHHARKYLPITEYTHWYTDPANGQTFYVVNGSQMHDVIPLSEFRSRIQKQYDNYGDRAKQAASNEGIDWKAISHALRAGYQLKQILTQGDFSYPLPETDFILQVKRGELDFMSEVNHVLEDLVEEVETLSEQSSLPEKVDVDFWEDWVASVHEREILSYTERYSDSDLEKE